LTMRTLVVLLASTAVWAGDEVYEVPPPGDYMRCADQDATVPAWRPAGAIGTIFTSRMPRLLANVSEGGTNVTEFSRFIKERNIKYVMPLVEDGDAEHADPPTSIPKVFKLYSELGMTIFRCPIKDFTAPPPKQHVECTQKLVDLLLNGHNVFLHCTGGTGRTGLMVSSAIKALGLTDPAKAAAYARRVGKPSYIETPSQVTALQALPTILPSAWSVKPGLMRDLISHALVCDGPTAPPELPAAYLAEYAEAIPYQNLYSTLIGASLRRLNFADVAPMWSSTKPSGPMPIRLMEKWAAAVTNSLPARCTNCIDAINTNSVTVDGFMSTLFAASSLKPPSMA